MTGIEGLNQAIADMQQIQLNKANPATYMRDRILKLLKAFEGEVEEGFELAVDVVGSTVSIFHLRAIKASNPDILIFQGKDTNGKSVLVVQHYSQASLVFLSLPKLEEKPFRIGFTADLDG